MPELSATYYTPAPKGSLPWHNLIANMAPYSQLTVSTDVQMTLHVGIHAQARKPSPGTIPQDGMTLDSGQFACVCRRGNLYIFYGMLTVTVSLWLQAEPPFMFISYQHSPEGSQGRMC